MAKEHLMCGKGTFKRLILNEKVKQLHLNEEGIFEFELNGECATIMAVNI